MGVPGTTTENDWRSFLFARKLNPAAPTFSIFSPFPKTQLTSLAIELGVLNQTFDFNNIGSNTESVLQNYSEEEKKWQVRLLNLGPLFCKLPDFMLPVFERMLKLPLDRLYSLIGRLFFSFIISRKIFPGAQPRNPWIILKSIWRTLRFLVKTDEKKT
ncbi:hypothetical protein ACQZV8_17935 [Magnetococcales bacterium HHB-1]